jgi:hypothetical protein
MIKLDKIMTMILNGIINIQIYKTIVSKNYYLKILKPILVPIR